MIQEYRRDTERRLQERTVDAWASVGEEGRGKLREATGSRKQALIRGCPNGATRHAEGMSPSYDGANVGN